MPTILTGTIGTASRDYTTFTLAEADVGTGIGTSTDLVTNDEAIVFSAFPDSVFDELVVFQNSLTTDATRNVTYQAASGEQHDGTAGTGVQINPTSGGEVFVAWDDYTVFDGLSFAPTTSSTFTTIYTHSSHDNRQNFTGIAFRCRTK